MFLSISYLSGDRNEPRLSPKLTLLYYFYNIIIILGLFIYFERDKDSTNGGGAEREERENPKQTPPCQHGARLERKPTKPGDYDLGQNQELDSSPTEPPRHPPSTLFSENYLLASLEFQIISELALTCTG